MSAVDILFSVYHCALYHFVYEMKFSQSKYKHISQLHTNLLKNFDKMLFLDEVELILARK